MLKCVCVGRCYDYKIRKCTIRSHGMLYFIQRRVNSSQEVRSKFGVTDPAASVLVLRGKTIWSFIWNSPTNEQNRRKKCFCVVHQEWLKTENNNYFTYSTSYIRVQDVFRGTYKKPEQLKSSSTSYKYMYSSFLLPMSEQAVMLHKKWDLPCLSRMHVTACGLVSMWPQKALSLSRWRQQTTSITTQQYNTTNWLETPCRY